MAERLSDIAYAKLNLALFAAAIIGGCVSAERSLPVASDAVACERAMAALVANRSHRAEQMASCDGATSEERSRFYVLRVNGFCREPEGCGSVLMGWYGVEASTGAVYEWDINGWQPGKQIYGQQ